MQKQKLEVLPPREIIRGLECAFSTMPVVPRDCVKALNLLSFNIQRQEFPPEAYKSIVFLVLRGFTSKDQYLRSLVYALLENVSGRTGDGILSINSILKDVNDKSTTCVMRNSALRALFTNLPRTMQYDFEKYIQMALVDEDSRDNAVCIASEYFHDMKIGSKVTEHIDDYHLSLFCRLPVNRYTSMLEIRRTAGGEVGKLSQYLDAGVDSITFLEAAKALAGARQELAAPLVEKAVSVLRIYLKKRPVEVFASMKVLSKLSVHFPTKVAKANREIGDLAQSSSQTVSMLAILTLLKTGTDETVKQLASKLEPLMQTMSESYKMMAIDTMEKLSKGSKPEFIAFLKNALLDRGEIGFKRFILGKFETLLGCESHQKEITKFLCTYIEDPEFYQLSMDILGMLRCLESARDLMHVYNRLILDNAHVRSCAFQTLFDLDGRFQTIESLRCTKDPETSRITSFLCANPDLPRDAFDFHELGDLRDEVLKYLPEPPSDDEDEGGNGDGLIKECRSIAVTPEDADFAISVVKKVFKERIVLEFTIESKMDKVSVASGVLILDSESGKLRIEMDGDDFKASRQVVKEVEVGLAVGNVFNGVFEYEICLQEDYEDVESDSITLIPFDINILDLVRPVPVEDVPDSSKSIELKFRARPTEAISKIVGISNMFLVADKDSFELSGMYECHPVVIKGEAKFVKYTVVDMQIMCDNSSVIDQIASVFD